MEILDQDMQMVRDFLKDAPEYIKGHFENLVSEHDKEANRADELEQSEKALRESHLKLECRVEELEEQVGGADEDHKSELASRDGVLTDVKYWLHDALIFKRLTTDPMQMLRKVEDVLQ